jgi:outer membrane protein assembly factor BamB
MLLCLSIFIGSATLAAGADWPQFMGPNGDGTSAEKGLLRAWPPGGPKVLWTFAMGPGYGGAAIRDGKVYVLDRVDQTKDVLRCLDLESGKEEWTFSYDAPGNISHDGSRSTPAVTEKHVYTVGPFGQFHCLDRATHQVVWKKNLLADHGTKSPRWAVAQSPLLYQNLVVVAPQADQVGVVAFDQATGAEKWRSEGIGPMGYASPKKVTLDQVDQIVVVTPLGAAAVRANDGKVLWKYAHACKIPIPNVTALGGDRLFVTGAYLAGSAIIQVSQDGGKWTVKELASVNQSGGHCHPGLLFQDHLYLLCNINERSDGMVCFDLAGKVVWQTGKDPSLDKGGSILTADGLIYVMDGRTGELYIVQPSPEGFKSLGKAKLLEGKEIWGPLALAGGKLLIRDQAQMKCVDLRVP